MLEKGGRKQPSDAVTPEEELKDPLVLVDERRALEERTRRRSTSRR